MDNLKRNNKKDVERIIGFPDKWAEQLTVNYDGKIKNTISNFVLILENDKIFSKKLRLNEHSKRVEIADEKGYHGILNIDLSKIKYIIESKYGIYSKEKVLDAIEIVAAETPYHPIKEYIESLKWDGIKRIDTAFADYFGAKPSNYNAMCMRLILLGAIERVYEPGCKFDCMVILKGAQGLGKSTFFRYICGDDKLYQGNFKDLDKSFELTNGKWICEMAELKVLKKEDNREAIKAYLSQVLDTYTLKYKTYSEDYPRQFIMIGTTNESIFLNDDTGERRFPIVECADKKQKFKKSIFDKDSKQEIQQLLAEAFVEYNNGIRMYDVPNEFQEEMEKIQSSYRSENTEKGIIEDYLLDKEEICLLQIWCEAFKHTIKDNFSSKDKNKIVTVLAEMSEWQLYEGAKDNRKQFNNIIVGKDYQGNPIYANYGKQKAWVRVKPAETPKEYKEKQRITDNINNLIGKKLTVEETFKKVNPTGKNEEE